MIGGSRMSAGFSRDRLLRLPCGSPAIDDHDRAAVDAVLRRGRLADGAEVVELERELAAFAGVPDAVALSSATAGIALTLAACGVSQGAEVITTALTFPGTTNAIAALGARPVFVDSTANGGSLDPHQVAEASSQRTAAICAVGRLGDATDTMQLCEVAAQISEKWGRGVRVVEDGAYGLGSVGIATSTSVAVPTVVSLHASKLITCGTGGAVLGVDERQAVEMRRWRNQGLSEDATRDGGPSRGFALRMGDINAALGRSQLRRIEKVLARRRRVTALLTAELEARGLGIGASTKARPAAFECRVPALMRDPLRHALHDLGVTTRVHYPLLASMPAWQQVRTVSNLAHSRRISATTITLPTSPDTTDEECALLATAVAYAWARLT